MTFRIFFLFFSGAGIRETYTKHRRSYAKALRSGALPQTPQLTASRQQVEKEFKKAIQKQDQKIELAMRMYDLVSRQIERIDSQMSSHGDWIGQRNGAYRQRLDESWRHDGMFLLYKRLKQWEK